MMSLKCCNRKMTSLSRGFGLALYKLYKSRPFLNNLPLGAREEECLIQKERKNTRVAFLVNVK